MWPHCAKAGTTSSLGRLRHRPESSDLEYRPLGLSRSISATGTGSVVLKQNGVAVATTLPSTNNVILDLYVTTILDKLSVSDSGCVVVTMCDTGAASLAPQNTDRRFAQK